MILQENWILSVFLVAYPKIDYTLYTNRKLPIPMSFSAFALFYGIILWLVFGQKMLLSKISAQKDKSRFYKVLFTYRCALLSVVINLILELALILYKAVSS